MKKGCARWVLSRWNSVSRGQDENAFAISKCEHFSTWRSIHCEREMGPFRKIDWRCSSRYFRFLSLGSYVTTQLPFSPPFPSIEPPQMRTFITDFFFSLPETRVGEGKNAKFVHRESRLDSTFTRHENPCRPNGKF